MLSIVLNTSLTLGREQPVGAMHPFGGGGGFGGGTTSRNAWGAFSATPYQYWVPALFGWGSDRQSPNQKKWAIAPLFRADFVDQSELLA